MASTKRWKNEYGFGRQMAEMEVLLHEFHKREMWVLLRTLVVSCDEKPTLEQINEALKALMKWNPSLRMSIRKDSAGKWEFCEQSDAKPRLECLYNENDWKKVMEDQMLRPIEDSDAPQFRCIYLPNAEHTSKTRDKVCAFVFVINHTIIDGMSTMATLRKFRLLLNEIVCGKIPNIDPWPKMHPPADYFFLRAADQLPDDKRRELEAIPPVDMATFFQPKSCLFVDKKGIEATNNPTIPPGQGLIIKTFTEEETKSLRLACRGNNTTIQAAAQIAGAVALAQIMQDSSKVWEPLEIKYNLAANLRPHIAREISVDYTGLYISLLFGFAATVEKEINDGKTAKVPFWKLAQESTCAIREQIKNQAFLQSFYAFSGVSGLSSLDSTDTPQNEGRGEEILYTTSYGAWDFPTETNDRVKPLMVYSNSSIHRYGPVFSQQLITVNGELSWTIGWSKRVASQETAQNFATLMFNMIEKAIKED